jgi:two-component system sensor kinase FixL|uniref:PAS domain-containing sensor histidine kinase n=1 Tax=Prosthecobacter sp. TaxID=1965333 RepID=UPI0037836504
MDWITVIFSMVASACLTLAAVHYLVWFRQRDAWANLMFALLVTSTAGMAAIELAMAREVSAVAYGQWLRWCHVPVWGVFVSLVGFIHFYYRVGRPWLAWLSCGLRTLVLVVNFLTPVNFNYVTISAVKRVEFLGGQASVAVGEPSAWSRFGQFSLVVLLAFVADVCVSEWRRGKRRTVLLVGVSTLFIGITAVVHVHLVLAGSVQTPVMASVFFLGMVAMIGYELSSRLVQAHGLSQQLQQNERQLRLSEERLSLATKAASIGVWSLDKKSLTYWVAPSTLALFGEFHGKDLSLEHVLSRMHAGDRSKVRQTLEQALEVARLFRVEYRMLSADGSVRWFLSVGRSQANEKGGIIGLTGVTLEITDHKLVENDLLQKKALLEAIFDSVPGMIYLYNAEGRLLRWNKNFEFLTGYTYDELRNVHVAQWFDGADLERMTREWERVFTAGQATVELDLIVKGGRKVPYLFTGVRVEMAGKPHMIGIGIDMSEQRRIESEVTHQREQLAHFSRVASLGELSGSLAHELNQPLGIILSNAQAAQSLLAHDPPDLAEVSDILADIVSADCRAGDVIKRLRALLERGKTTRQPVDINENVQEVLRLTRSDLIEHDITVSLKLEDPLPQVLADRVQVQQVLLNLIVNARDAMEGTPHEDRVLTLTSAKEGDHVHLTVQDRGCGLPADVDQIFKPFHTSKANGLGMGLAICRKLVTAHEGRLWAEPNADGGATFHVLFPALKGAV